MLGGGGWGLGVVGGGRVGKDEEGRERGGVWRGLAAPAK